MRQEWVSLVGQGGACVRRQVGQWEAELCFSFTVLTLNGHVLSSETISAGILCGSRERF